MEGNLLKRTFIFFRPKLTWQWCGALTGDHRAAVVVGAAAAAVGYGAGGGGGGGSSSVEGLRAGQLRGHGQGVTLSAWQLLPVVGCLQQGSAARPGAAEDTAGRRVQVKDQREHRLAGDVVKLDLPAAEVLSGVKGVDLAPLGAPLCAGGVVIRVLDVDSPPSLTGEDV